ncbi:beta-class carbonic anhydrase [Pseudonocardia sichuanensis]
MNSPAFPPRPRPSWLVVGVASEDLLRRHQVGGGRRAAAGAAGLAAVPSLHTAVVTCMDTRIDVLTLFGANVGEAHVLRNAGGVVTDDVVRSIVISQRKLATRDVLLVQHSKCGLTTFTDAEFCEELAADTGIEPSWRPQAFPDPAESVRRGIARLRRDPFLHPDTRVRGFVLDIETFALDEVFVDGERAG